MADKEMVAELINQVQNFHEGTWNTPNTYCANFKPIPRAPGIYLWIGYKKLFCRQSGPEVLYIGSSKNLYNRAASHNIKGLIDRDYEYSRFYFLEMSEDYIAYEIELIKAIRPKYNLQHTRG